jgi:epoxyqueuosine reductase
MRDKQKRTEKGKEGKDHYEQLREFALREGASLFGVAETSAVKDKFHSLSSEALQGLDRAIAMAFHLSDRVMEDVVDGPTKLYFFHYQRVNVLLDELALKITNFIQEGGWQALPIPASQIVDWENQRAHVSHKHVAKQAGLGWIGRNNLLVTPLFGARVRLITVLTSMPLATNDPLPWGCEGCSACLSSCPSQSIKEKPDDFDHIGCYHQVKALVKAAGISQNICGLCVKACQARNAVSSYELRVSRKG